MTEWMIAPKRKNSVISRGGWQRQENEIIYVEELFRTGVFVITKEGDTPPVLSPTSYPGSIYEPNAYHMDECGHCAQLISLHDGKHLEFTWPSTMDVTEKNNMMESWHEYSFEEWEFKGWTRIIDFETWFLGELNYKKMRKNK